MKLLEILDLETQIENSLIATGGEMPIELENLCNDVAERKADKLLAYHNFLEHLDSKVDLMKAKEKAVKERRQAIEKQVNNMREYLKSIMLNKSIKKLESNDVCITLAAAQDKLVLDDNGFFEDRYYKVEKTLDRAAIKKELMAGNAIEGASLEQAYSLRIRGI